MTVSHNQSRPATRCSRVFRPSAPSLASLSPILFLRYLPTGQYVSAQLLTSTICTDHRPSGHTATTRRPRGMLRRTYPCVSSLSLVPAPRPRAPTSAAAEGWEVSEDEADRLIRTETMASWSSQTSHGTSIRPATTLSHSTTASCGPFLLAVSDCSGRKVSANTLTRSPCNRHLSGAYHVPSSSSCPYLFPRRHSGERSVTPRFDVVKPALSGPTRQGTTSLAPAKASGAQRRVNCPFSALLWR